MKGYNQMAKQTPHGRVGRIKARLQALNPYNQRWVELNTKTGRFLNVKSDKKPFKAVRHLKSK